MIVTTVLGWLVWRLPSPALDSARPWWTILVLAGLLVLTFSLQGHGAARGSVIAVGVIWLHLAAMIIWLGGLPLLILALRQAVIPAAVLVPRFSEAALICVGTIILTGGYNAFVYVRSGEALTATTYGQAIIAKTGLFAVLYILGSINLFYWSPHLQGESSSAQKGLIRTVRLEIAFGVILLLAVAILSGVAPALDALQAHREQGIIGTAKVDGVDMLVHVLPGESGENEIGVEFQDPRPGASAVPPEILVRLTSLSMDMGTQQIEATSIDGLRYTARGTYFSMTGPWEIEIILRRPGFNDVRHSFELNIEDVPSP
jgi:copper transport protein